jgi:hypothetical protein
MAKFKVGYDNGYVGCEFEDVIEADSLEEAEEEVWQMAIEKISIWAELIGEDDTDE